MFEAAGAIFGLGGVVLFCYCLSLAHELAEERQALKRMTPETLTASWHSLTAQEQAVIRQHYPEIAKLIEVA